MQNLSALLHVYVCVCVPMTFSLPIHIRAFVLNTSDIHIQ